MLVSPPRPESKKPIGLLSIYVIILSKMWYNEPIDYVCGVADRKGPLNHRCLLGLWYNEPIDYVCSVAERKGLLNRRCPPAAVAALAAAKNGRRPARLAVRAGDIIVRVLRAGAVPVQNNFKVAVVTCGVTGASDFSYLLTSAYSISF